MFRRRLPPAVLSLMLLLVSAKGLTDELAWRSEVSIGDIDADGTMDLVIHSDRDNAFHVCERKNEQPDPRKMDFARGPALKLENGEPVKGWFGGQNNNSDNHSEAHASTNGKSISQRPMPKRFPRSQAISSTRDQGQVSSDALENGRILEGSVPDSYDRSSVG